VSELEALYQSVVLEHHRHPRHTQALTAPTHQARGHNPWCGDTVAVSLEVTDAQIRNVCCEAQGCALSRAAASILSEAIATRSVAEARALGRRFQQSLEPSVATDPLIREPDETREILARPEFQALFQVRAHPSRVGCVRLCWHTLEQALIGS
jgi:nitrogen fixation protein NifU and related proteins